LSKLINSPSIRCDKISLRCKAVSRWWSLQWAMNSFGLQETRI